MLQRRKSRSIRFTLNTSLIAAVTIGMAVLIFSVLTSTSLISRILRDDMEQMSSLMDAMLERELASQGDQVWQLSESNALKVLMSLHLPAQARRYLERMVSSARFSGMWLMDPQGRTIASALAPGVPATPPISPFGRGVRLIIVNGRLMSMAWAPIGEDEHASGHLLAMRPFPPDNLLARSSRPGRSGLALIDLDQVLARSPWLDGLPDKRLSLARHYDQINLPTGSGEQTFLVHAEKLQLTNAGPTLTAALVHNLAEARQPFAVLSGLFIGGWAVVIISFLALTRYVNVSLVKPVLELAKAADDIRSDGASLPYIHDWKGERAGNEITTLYRSFFEMVSSLQDAKLQAEEAEARFRSLYENSVEGIFQVDRQDRLLSANPALAHILGYSAPDTIKQEIDGRVSSVFADADQREQVKQLLLTHDRLVDYEALLIRKDGQKTWTSLAARTVRDENGSILYYEGSIVDISERKKRELAERRQQSAESASQAKSRFLATMSHEIRTPLNAILGMADLLWESPLSLEQRNYVRIFRSSGELLLSLINDILDLSRIESGKLSLNSVRFDLREVMEKTGETMAPAAQAKGLEFICHMPPHVPRLVEGDPIRLRQILFNLLGNAVKFTSAGDILLECLYDLKSGEFRFVVRDTGIGIAEDKLRIIFDRFSQADDSMIRRYGGSGLGLAIAKRLVTIMEGRIQVQSKQDEGSTFTCSIPLPVLGHQPSDEPDPAESLKGLKILAVEPHPLVMETLREHLQALDVDLMPAESADQALQLARESRDQGDPPDLALIESRLADSDGASLASDLDHILPGLPMILLVPVGASPDERNRARAAGNTTLLVKPIGQRKLILALQRALDPARGKDAGQTEPPKPGPARPGLRILLADDSDNNRLLIRHFFKDSGHELIEASNGREAVDLYENQPVDLVLMDLEMPVMDGYDATRAIRGLEAARDCPETPVIALTAHAFAEVRDKCMDAGCTDFLTKPIPKKKLLERIDRVLAGESSLED